MIRKIIFHNHSYI